MAARAAGPALEPNEASLAEYNARREQAPWTAGAQYELGLWCERNGLTDEAMIHFAAVVQLDPRRESAWKHLGYRRHRGRWTTADQIAAQKEDAQAQRRADRHWESLLRKWRSWLRIKGKRTEAQRLLAGVTELRAAPSVWRVFGASGADDQAVAVQVLGQIASAPAARALAVLAVFGKLQEVRRAATETLAHRDPREYADLLIGLLREPVEYVIVPVGGPGMPGSLTVHGSQFDIKRIYAPAPPPSIPIFPGEDVTFDRDGLPIIQRHTDTANLPFAWVDSYENVFPSRSAISPHVPVTIPLGRMWLENAKTARLAHEQMQGDIAAIERENDGLRAANGHVAQVLRQVTGQSLPSERTAWAAWLSRLLGRTYSPDPPRPRPTITQVDPLNYLPRNAGDLGYDPFVGYYLRVKVLW
jgi:hypothetical protein